MCFGRVPFHSDNPTPIETTNASAAHADGINALAAYDNLPNPLCCAASSSASSFTCDPKGGTVFN